MDDVTLPGSWNCAAGEYEIHIGSVWGPLLKSDSSYFFDTTVGADNTSDDMRLFPRGSRDNTHVLLEEFAILLPRKKASMGDDSQSQSHSIGVSLPIAERMPLRLSGAR